MRNKEVQLKFNTDLFSKYRGVLMGIAILGVSILHAVRWANCDDTIISKLLTPIARIAFTEGFLFLSGFGLFFSFNHNSCIYRFYRKRFFRLLFPFMIMSLPFLIYRMFFEGMPVGDFLLHWTTLWFWIHGNDGMWYIAVSVLLYILFPLLYKFLFRDKQNILPKTVMVVLFLSGGCVLLYTYANAYYEMTEIGISKLPMFVIGMFFGHLALRHKEIKSVPYFMGGVALLSVMYSLKKTDGFYVPYYEMVYRLLFMPIVCILISFWHGKGKIVSFFKWFGTYSLEIYILQMFFIDSVGKLENMIQISEIHKPLVQTVITFSLVFILCVPIHNIIDKIILCMKKLN